MQVSHVETANTHAIMGGGEARAFGMSQSVEFFTVLSDTLYRDKKRAVAREVICNAWDAHIVSGKTDVPVEITISDEEMSIKDFGPGISDKRIRPIYCIYGESTKIESEEETGGFGLGSKAPFAYSDHFSVTSCFEGTKTIYAISRGGMETAGIPDMRPMVSVPTKDTGLTVTIPMRSISDRREFEQIAELVAKQGGMKVKLNGRVLDVIDYTEARKTGFMVTLGPNSQRLNESSVYLLYGTVLYPVSSTEDEITSAVNLCNTVVPQGYKTILVASPNSVGVTPSREALSYTDTTIATVKRLSESMARQVKPLIRHAETLLLNKKIKKAGRKGLHGVAEGHHDLFQQQSIQVADALSIARIAANHNFYNRAGENLPKRVGAIAAKQFPNSRRSLRRAFLGGYAYSKRGGHNQTIGGHFRKEIAQHSTRLHLRAMARVGTLKTAFVITGDNSEDFRLRPLVKADMRRHSKKILIIAQNRTEALIKAKSIAQKTGKYFDDWQFIGCTIPRSKPTLRASLTKEAEKLGLQVEEVKVAPPKKTKVTRPKGKFIGIEEFSSDGQGFQAIGTVENPTHYIRVSATLTQMCESRWWPVVRDYLLKAYNNKVVIVRGAAQIRAVKKAGAVDVMAEIWTGFKKRFKTRDVQFGALIKNGTVLRESRGYRNKVNHAENILRAVPETAFEFIPARLGSKQKALEAARLIEVLEEYIGWNIYSDCPFEDDDLRALKHAAKKTFAADMQTKEEFDHRWRDIYLISVHNMKTEEHSDLVVKLLRTLKITTPMKEETV